MNMLRASVFGKLLPHSAAFSCPSAKIILWCSIWKSIRILTPSQLSISWTQSHQQPYLFILFNSFVLSQTTYGPIISIFAILSSLRPKSAFPRSFQMIVLSSCFSSSNLLFRSLLFAFFTMLVYMAACCGHPNSRMGRWSKQIPFKIFVYLPPCDYRDGTLGCTDQGHISRQTSLMKFSWTP